MRRQKIIFNLSAVLLIMGVTLYDIKNLDMITVLNDEFGYWSNAALIAGNDWRPLMAETPYYSLGYSLLLAPLFLFFEDYAILYKSAIALNALLLVAAYFCAKYIAANLLNIKDEVIKFSISIISVLSGTVIFQSHVAWSETLLTFLMWASVALMVSIEKKNSPGKVLPLSVLCIYMLVVHQRTMVCMAICSVCVIVILVGEKRNKKQIFLFLSALAIVYLAYKWVKSVQISQFYGNSAASNLNNVGVADQFLLNILTRLITNLKPFFSSFMGKITVSLFMTYFTLPIAAYQYVCNGIRYIKTKEKPEYFWTNTYIIFSLFCMLTATSLQVMGDSRKDLVVYTRYFDYTLGPVIMLGIYGLLSGNRKQKRLFAETYLIYGILAYKAFEEIKKSESYFNVPCSPVYGGIMQYSNIIQGNIDWVFNWEYCKGLALVFALILFLAICLVWLIKKQGLRYICLAGFLIVSQIHMAHYANIWLNNARDGFRASVKPIYERMEDDDYPIYYIRESGREDYYVHPKWLQFLLNSRTINVAVWDEKSRFKDNSWVLVENDSEISNPSYVLIEATDTMKLYQKSGE